MSGFRSFGNALAGGGLDVQQIENDTTRDMASVEHALYRARKQRDEYEARMELEQKMVDNGVPEEAAAELSTLFRAGMNPEQLSGYRRDTQHMGFRDEAAAAAREGNADLTNMLLSVVAERPMTLNKVEGNTIISPYTKDANARPTDVGAAQAEMYRNRGESYIRPRTTGGSAPAAPRDYVKETIAKEVIARYGKAMAQPGADVQRLTALRDKELAALGVGPLIQPGTDPDITGVIAGLNAGTMTEQEAADLPGMAAPQERKVLAGRTYVKINGEWYEE